MASKHTLRFAAFAATLLALVQPVRSQPSQATGQLVAESDVYAALTALNNLAQHDIDDISRSWRSLRAARRLLESHGVTLNTSAWDDAKRLIEKRPRTHIASERSELDTQLRRALAFVAGDLLAAMPAAAACDFPNDEGGKLVVFWQPQLNAKNIKLRRKDVTRDKPWIDLKSDIAGGAREYKDDHLLRPGREYKYRILAIAKDGGETLVAETPSVRARGNWVNTNRLWFGAFVAFIMGAVVFYIGLARRGVTLTIRKIAGLEAVDDAVGRATEMGRPILFVPGLQDMNDIQTVAGITVLGHVARVAAEHDATVEVPTGRSLVMTAARETVHASYIDAGRPDGYDEKKIYYTTDEQFGFVAAVTGTIVREKPATCFYMGAFFAESLILAETANMAGSIQIAGTAMPAQLPFFVAACDYTLIGEEFFAASAYLSGEPQQLGSLKGQDVGKSVAIVFISLGVALALFVAMFGHEFGFVGGMLDYLQHSVLESAGS